MSIDTQRLSITRNGFCATIVSVAEHFGNWVKQERERLGITQAELARRSDTSRAQINKIEKDAIARAYPDTIRRLAKGLQVPEETIYQKAGMLTQMPEETKLSKELVYYFGMLSIADQQEVVNFVRFKASRL